VGKIIYKGNQIDEVVITLFRSPRSYTGEDLVEISCHGSHYIQQKILQVLILSGARLARPGEFTQRAFLNGKLDLSQAEGVADLISSESEASHRLALNQMRGGFSDEIKKLRNELIQFVSLIELELDFSEEDVEFASRQQLSDLIQKMLQIFKSLIQSFEYGNAIKNGIPVAIIGRTNSGKSTLLNRLLNEERAIVSEIAGTTRDFIEDTMIIHGILFRFIDTAGLRHTTNAIEAEGIARTMKKVEQASIVIILVDINEPINEIDKAMSFLHEKKMDLSGKLLIFVLNKSDTLPLTRVKEIQKHYVKEWSDIAESIAISAKQVPELKSWKNY
jgi:tRNA modification GTPase